MDGQASGRDTHHPCGTGGGLGAASRADLTSEEAGLQYPAPKTRFSSERVGCSVPGSGPPLPSQEPLPGRVKLKGRGVEEGDRQCEEGDGAASSVPWGRWGVAAREVIQKELASPPPGC